MDRPPTPQFGKRQAVISPGAEPVKRSHHVALLVMGTLAVGGGAYTLMPKENCVPASPSIVAPSAPERIACTGGSGGSRFGGWWSRSGFYGGNSASSGTSTPSGSAETTRGGFGSFGRAFATHFSGS